MAVAGTETDGAIKTVVLNIRLTEVLRQRVKDVARIRGTSEGSSARWLLERGLDWYEGLSREQREAV